MSQLLQEYTEHHKHPVGTIKAGNKLISDGRKWHIWPDPKKHNLGTYLKKTNKILANVKAGYARAGVPKHRTLLTAVSVVDRMHHAHNTQHIPFHVSELHSVKDKNRKSLVQLHNIRTHEAAPLLGMNAAVHGWVRNGDHENLTVASKYHSRLGGAAASWLRKHGKPSKPVALYRGHLLGADHNDHEVVNWSLNKDVAMQYAKQKHQPGVNRVAMTTSFAHPDHHIMCSTNKLRHAMGGDIHDKDKWENGFESEVLTVRPHTAGSFDRDVTDEMDNVHVHFDHEPKMESVDKGLSYYVYDPELDMVTDELYPLPL